MYAILQKSLFELNTQQQNHSIDVSQLFWLVSLNRFQKSLNSAPDIQKWLPSIKRDLDEFLKVTFLKSKLKDTDFPKSLFTNYNIAPLWNIELRFYWMLQKAEVGCYPERHIDEINERIDTLRREYKAFLRKLRQLDPSIQHTPWDQRAYKETERTTSNSEEGKQRIWI